MSVLSSPQIEFSSFFDLFATDLKGEVVSFDEFRGRSLLIVNIASKCKLLKTNIEGLRKLKQKFGEGK